MSRTGSFLNAFGLKKADSCLSTVLDNDFDEDSARKDSNLDSVDYNNTPDRNYQKKTSVHQRSLKKEIQKPEEISTNLETNDEHDFNSRRVIRRETTFADFFKTDSQLHEEEMALQKKDKKDSDSPKEESPLTDESNPKKSKNTATQSS